MIAFLLWPFRLWQGFRQSIAYLPTLLALLYWGLGWLALFPPVADAGLPGVMQRLGLPAPDDTTPLLSALLGGMISLVVFSFTTVMSVLAQAGGQFSQKLVFGLMTERPHQWVLGHYLGTILFLVMLLIVPHSSEDSGVWRSLAVYLACAMVLHSLALFVFFIHSISESQCIDSVTRDLYRHTQAALKRLENNQSSARWRYLPGRPDRQDGYPITTREAGYIQNADLSRLAHLAAQVDGTLHLTFQFGDFVPTNMPALRLIADEAPSDAWCETVLGQLTYREGESIDDQPLHGMSELMEVAIKALSPGINDPGTARLCVHQLTELLRQRLTFQPCNALVDTHGHTRVTWPVERFDSLLHRLFAPILHYGRQDQSIGLALLKASKTLSLFADAEALDALQAFAERVVQVLAEGASHRLDRQFINERLDVGDHCLTLPTNLPDAPLPRHTG